MRQTWSARKIAFLAMAIALAVVIEIVCSMYLRMPQGGSFSLVMVPIAIVGYFYGIGPAVMTALAAGVLQGLFVPPT
ncbi:MAG: energy-coupled thiamine transporter ThiT, partial [Bacilli bacterium]|nr:energy-coupled thiamine transporter ThiT [Bacilli bacterium]